MKLNLSKANWSVLEIPLIILALLAAFYVAMDEMNIRFNFTPSEPVGLYRMIAPVPIMRGDIVSFCHSGDHGKFMLAGGCPNGTAPMLKYVAAIAGDIVVVGDAGVMVNGRMLPNSRPALHAFSDPFLKLPVLRGHFQLKPGEFWAYGSGDSARSYDSRYYGPVKEQDIISIVARD